MNALEARQHNRASKGATEHDFGALSPQDPVWCLPFKRYADLPLAPLLLPKLLSASQKRPGDSIGTGSRSSSSIVSSSSCSSKSGRKNCRRLHRLLNSERQTPDGFWPIAKQLNP